MSPAEAPRTSAWLFRGFTRYVRRYLRRSFERVGLSRSVAAPQPGDRPLIVFANHPSWWDPMFFYLLAGTLYPGRRHFGPMDADALRRYPVLGRLGIFGVERGPRGAVRFLRAGEAALRQPGGTLWITPQGHFVDARSRPVRLEGGLAHLARRVPGALVVPLAIEVGFWNESAPVGLLRFGAPVDVRDGEAAAALTARCADALEQTMNELAVEAARRDPAAFHSLLEGRVGVGGMYDAWRRLRAWLGLRRPELGHERDRRLAGGSGSRPGGRS